MTDLRTDLQAVLERLVAGATRGAVTLDDIGDALGTSAVSTDDIERLFHALEARGLGIVGPEGGGGEARLGRVVQVARALRTELGRVPSVEEIAQRSGLEIEVVRHALALARVVQR